MGASDAYTQSAFAYTNPEPFVTSFGIDRHLAVTDANGTEF
jgi:hypothetical protein